MPFHLDRISFNDGTEIACESLVVLVGPNNAGKSQALRDLKRLLTEEHVAPTVLRGIRILPPDTLYELQAYGIAISRDPFGNMTIASLAADLHGVSVRP